MARRRRRKGLSAEGEAALEEIHARQRTWVVVPEAEWFEEEGLVVVRAPRFRGKAGKALVGVLSRDPEFNLRLDEFGSLVWRLIDGQRTVGEISDATVREMGAEEGTAQQRLLMFLRSLNNAGVIRVLAPAPNS
jgi:hypothetical protein